MVESGTDKVVEEATGKGRGGKAAGRAGRLSFVALYHRVDQKQTLLQLHKGNITRSQVNEGYIYIVLARLRTQGED